MRSTPRIPTAIAPLFAALAMLSSSLVVVRPALADTPAAPTCQTLENKCLKHVRASATTAPAADGIERPHMTEAECYDSFHAAESTGVWPAHVPFNFAIKCAS